MQAMIYTATSFFTNRGMAINNSKSVSMSATPQIGKKVNIPATSPVFRISNKKIPIISEINAFRYLGHMFGTSGTNKPSLINIVN